MDYGFMFEVRGPSGLGEIGRVRIGLSWENGIMVMSGNETSGGRLKK